MNELDLLFFRFLYSLPETFNIPTIAIVFIAEDLAYILLAATALFLVYSAMSHHRKIKAAISLIIAATLSSLTITQFIRLIWHRPRPLVSLNLPEIISEASYSFPSAHAAVFFALSTIIYFYNKKIGVLFFVATALICLGRILAGVHYPSDILAGLFVGTTSGLAVHTLLHFPKHRRFLGRKKSKK